MSIPSDTPRIAGPYSGDGTTLTFAFGFQVFSAADLHVVLADSAGVETVQTLITDYTVALNPDQASTPGGSITMALAPATGELLALTSAVAATQDVSLTTGGGFYPSVISTALDRLTILAQQLKEKVSRAVMVDVTSNVIPSALMAQLSADASGAANSAAASSGSASAASVSAAQAAAALNTFTDQYQGAFAVDPTLRPDGSALQPGDQYFNTLTNLLMIYSGAVWGDAGNSLTADQIVTLIGAQVAVLANANTFALPVGVPAGVGAGDAANMSQLVLKADLNGDPAQVFNVADALTNTEAVNLGQAGAAQILTDEFLNRALATTYTNSTSNIKFVFICLSPSATTGGVGLSINGATAVILSVIAGSQQLGTVAFAVFPGETYNVTFATGSVNKWTER